MRIVTEHDFAAAHRLPGHPGACSRLHGHHYRFEVHVEGPVRPDDGVVIDFDDLHDLVQERAVALLDHGDLNTLLSNPTAENIVVWIWERLKPALPGLAAIRLWETPRYSVIYKGEQALP